MPAQSPSSSLPRCILFIPSWSSQLRTLFSARLSLGTSGSSELSSLPTDSSFLATTHQGLTNSGNGLSVCQPLSLCQSPSRQASFLFRLREPFLLSCLSFARESELIIFSLSQVARSACETNAVLHSGEDWVEESETCQPSMQRKLIHLLLSGQYMFSAFFVPETVD